MTHHPQDPQTPKEPTAAQAARDIIAQVAGRAFMKETALASRPSDPVAWSINHIAENYEGILRVEEIAQSTGMSKFHFIRKFQNEVGITPGLFIQRYRMCQAMNRLTASATTIRDIAREVGYTDPAAFSRAFLKTVGTQPNLYRQESKR
jgi:AraC-like DNA-binding protein